MSYFIKETHRKGDLYYQIYEGHYDKEKGYSVQTSYKVLGYLSDLKAKGIDAEGYESIDVEYTDEEMSASFNPHFLLDPFKHLPVDHVLLKINDVVSPIAIESGDGFLYILLPTRKH